MDENQSNLPHEDSSRPPEPGQPLVQDISAAQTSARTHTTRKALLLSLAGTLALGSIVVAYFLFNNGQVVRNQAADKAQVATLGASLVATEGNVEYIQNSSDSWKKAKGGESLKNHASVKTSANGRAIVLFDDGSIARLNSQSEIHLSSLKANGTEITLVSGQVYSRVVASKHMPYVVVTANERFAALGTAYKTSTDGTKGSVEVYQSKVKVGSTKTEVGEGNSYNTQSKTLAALDLKALQTDEFVQWNKKMDSTVNEFKDKLGVLDDALPIEAPVATPPAATAPSATAAIRLSATTVDHGVKLSWSLSGVSSTQGFKIVRDAKDATPTFGENSSQYVSSAAARSETWHDESGGTYYYRVCIYTDGACTNYSNVVQATSPNVAKEQIISGGISLNISGQTLSWSLNGGTAPHGFKVVLSTSQNPTYPENSIMYLSSGDRSVSLPNKDPGMYYVRVCKYTNGTQTQGCVDYSNQVIYHISA